MPLSKLLSSHQVETVFERGWSTLENGRLLAAAEREGFEVLVTTDQNLRYQQNLVMLMNFCLQILVLEGGSLRQAWARSRQVFGGAG